MNRVYKKPLLLLMLVSGLRQAEAQASEEAQSSSQVIREFPSAIREEYPLSWKKLGMPTKFDRADKNNSTRLNEYASSLGERIVAGKVSDEDFEIVLHLLTPAQGQPDFHEGNAFRAASMFIYAYAGLQKNNDPRFKRIALALRPCLDSKTNGWGAAMLLAQLKDKDSIEKILSKLPEWEKNPSLKSGTVNALRRLGYELPFEEDKPRPKAPTVKP